ncbi:YopX family protein [Staphylococcus felis]|uniref:YopX family protein n=1 Tax=Staphylococcus felis TaxID=46127 RepID=UPI000E28B156|nr:YopX family protein [Staphylococcus felis]REI16769.1 hypothetical protein DOS73_02575 [Staphylococcus felis]
MIPKFRVWDRRLNEMHSSDEVIIQIKGRNILVALADSLHQISDYSLMQSTGIYDNNTVEIFDKDIVRDVDDGAFGLVEYEEGQFCVTFGNVNIALDEVSFYVQVIGNIYESKG